MNGFGAGSTEPLHSANRMNIGLSTCMIQGGKTGVAQYVFALVRALLARPDCPKLTLFVLESEVRLFDFVDGRAEVVPIPDRFRPALRNIAWHQIALPRLTRGHGLDVLHVPSYRRLLWSKPCPLVATIHDLAPFHLRGKYDPARMFYGRVVVRALARRQDRIIAVSQNTAQDLQRFFGLRPARIDVILNGLDHSRFNPGDPVAARDETAKRWQLNRPYLLYVSRLEHPGKNHVRLIEAFSRFKAATGSDWLLALGGSDWHGAEVIHQAAGRSAVRDDIRFLGYVPDADLPVLYRSASAAVYPSLFEGFGFPPVEAMACGCPVLSSRRGALGEVVGEAAGLLDPEDISQMKSALTRIAAEPALRQELRAAGLSNAQRFNWEQNAAQVLRCYAQVNRNSAVAR
jgi:glycosyltransferase involved in cell wall biosynthesis